MIFKTEGIVLRILPFSKTSHTVLWLTPDRGKLATLVKGAQRAKSHFLGQYDLFYTCEILYYRRERSGLHLLKECTPDKTRTCFRSDWRAFVTASYFCDLATRLCPTESPQPEVHRLMNAVLDVLDTGRLTWPLVFWFELRLLGLVGLGPQLDCCSTCGQSPDSGLRAKQRRLFSPAKGGLLCTACASGASDLMPIEDGVVRLLRDWQGSVSPRDAVDRPGLAISHRTTIRELLGRFLAFHVDACPDSREWGFQALQSLP